MASHTIQTRVSAELKQNAEALFANMGLGISDAIRMFLQQSLHVGGIPFQPRAHTSYAMGIPNLEALDNYLSASEQEMRKAGAREMSFDELLGHVKHS